MVTLRETDRQTDRDRNRERQKQRQRDRQRQTERERELLNTQTEKERECNKEPCRKSRWSPVSSISVALQWIKDVFVATLQRQSITTESRRDQEEGGELDSQEGASPEEIKSREVVLG